ncbi:VWA domain-containing protein [Nocardioides lentus]|uniref:VWA domain-containing protein n=1 Tax=Nocardioides lentus TaxID=338077 RepID=A0ABN2PR73_9ACTN
MALLDRHLGLVGALRDAGVPVALSEDLDALAAVRLVDWDRRETLRETYAATLLKRAGHRPVLDALFDLWFPPRVGAGAEPAPTADDGDAVEDLRQRVAGAITGDAVEPGGTGGTEGGGSGGSGEGGGAGGLDALAVEAVGRLGRLSGRAPGLSTWSAYTTLRRLGDLPEGPGPDAARRAAAFRRAVESEALRRVAEQKGPERLAASAVRAPVDRIAFTAAGTADLAAIRREIAPLARRLAARLARDHTARGRRGTLDVRRTVRASMATGGVPMSPVLRPRRERRTDLVVLCDVSGSVAHFARFTLLLVVALREQFRGVRAFAFVDDVVEVTDRLRPGGDVGEVLADLLEAGRGADRSGRTDYGRALRRFADEHADALGPRSTLLVLGDARSNYADPGLPALRRLVAGARRAWWLNPEPVRHWDTGDSVAARYAEVVAMAECRDLDQLARFVRDHL